MRKHLLWILPLLLLLLPACSRQTPGLTAKLGENFYLAIGQSVSITGENLEVRFIKVIGDSRCAQGVQCIWAGEANSQVEFSRSGSTYQKVLTQPGLTEPPQTGFMDYQITFDLKPYPVAGQKTEDKDYLLQLNIKK